MNYIAAITDFFNHPKWMMNLLLTAVCMLIPIVGPIVVLGWLITVLWMPPKIDLATAPEFEFGKFGIYLERGLWPFLVALAAAVGCGIVVAIVGTIPSVILGFVFGHGRGFLPLIGGGISTLIWLVLWVGVVFCMLPLVIRAILVQDFAKAFDIAYVKRFVGLMWMDMLITVVFAWIASVVLSFAGLIVLCVGVYAAAALIHFMMIHLYRQLYNLYLSRGGEAVPVSPKLTGGTVDLPPPPAAV